MAALRFQIEKNKSFKYMIAATIVLIVALSVFFYVKSQKGIELELVGEDGNVFLSIPVEEGTEFSVTFIHSVNKSPVTDFYVIENQNIYVQKTLYYDFGAGVQTELQDGQTLTYTEDGGMLVSGFHNKMDPLAYVVGMVSDHVLTVKDQSYSLRDICGKGSYVTFRCKK